MLIEKQTRNAEDVEATKEICLTIVKCCFNARDWEAGIRSLFLLSKRKGQLKEAVKAIVQEGITYVDHLIKESHPLRDELIEALRKITEGKIYVENERARLTRTYAGLHEKEGQVEKAAKLLQSIQVETYGSMEQREKIEFLLEQTRLCLDCGDFVRAKIIANKVSIPSIKKPELEDLKISYHRLLIRYYTHQKDFLEVCRAYLCIYDTGSIKAQQAECEDILRLVCAYVSLSEHAPEQSDLLHRVVGFKQLEDLAAFKDLLTFFITVELICWSDFQKAYQPIFASLSIFSTADNAKVLWETLRSRVIEHNIRVIAAHYTRITTSRFAELLELDDDQAEQHLSRLVIGKQTYARIDRPKRIIAFRKPAEPSDELTAWSSDISQLLGLMQKTSHLIQRENMVYKARRGLSQSQPL